MNVSPTWAVDTPASLNFSSAGGTYNFGANAIDPQPWDTLYYTLNPGGQKPLGYDINSSSGILTVLNGSPDATVTIRVSDNEFAYADHVCSVTVADIGTGVVDLPTLRAAGYKIVTDYPGVYVNSPTQDSKAGIQTAINDSNVSTYPLYFPPGTYYVSDTIFTLLWSRWDVDKNNDYGTNRSDNLVGCSFDRPVIKLMSTAVGFSNPAVPRPVVCHRTLKADNDTHTGYPPVIPPPELVADPFGLPPGYIDGNGIGFHQRFLNFVIDTSGKSGAVGVLFSTCQDSWMSNIKVIATGSYIGIFGPGGTHGSSDLEVLGGRYGIYTGRIREAVAVSGTTAVGVKLYDQTVAAIYNGDGPPNGIVGFHIRVPVGGRALNAIASTSATANGSTYLVDGIIECADSSAVALTIPDVSSYARNVYVTGTNNVLKTDALATVTQTGTWKRIAEYATRTTRGNAAADITVFPDNSVMHRALMEGVVNANQQLIASVVPSAAPPSDLVSRHLCTAAFPALDDGLSYIDISKPPYNIAPYRPNGSPNLSVNTSDVFYLYANWSIIVDAKAAIDAAIAQAQVLGHNRVFIPRGVYYISGTINLLPNTQLFGAGAKHTILCALNTWVPSTSPTYMIASASSATGRASLSSMFIFTPRKRGTLDGALVYSGDRFSHILWRTGRRSFTWNLETDIEFYDPDIPNQDRQVYTILGPNGGGRHYWFEENGRGNTCPTGRGLLIRDVVEPTSIYGSNFEISKTAAYTSSCMWNIEVNNSRNVRIYDNKREGNSGTILVHNSRNVAMWGPGVNMTTVWNSPDYTRAKISGTSTDVVIALQTVQKAPYARADRYMLTEELSGQPIVRIANWEGVALYKRGNLDDSLMTHT